MTSGDTDPWSGDDVPVASGLGDIVWDTPSPIDATSTDSADHADDGGSRIRRLVIPAVAVGVVGVAGLALLAWPRSSESTADEPAPTTPAAPTTLDTLPPATTPSTTGAPTPSTTDDVVTTEPFTAIARGELPPALAEAELVTDLVVVTDNGELVTLSLPDGIVTERVDLGLSRESRFDLGPTTLTVAPEAAMYATGTQLIVLPSGGQPLTIDRAEFDLGATSFGPIPLGWVSDVSGENVFVVVSFDETGAQTEWLVSSSGDVSPAPAQRSGSFARPVFSLGTRIVLDAGGTYRVDANGDSNRISNGDLLALSETQILVRECDAARVCNAVLRNYQGDEVRVVDLPPSFRSGFLAASLSPGDQAVAFADFNSSGERMILDLDTGETTSFAERPSDFAPPTWSSDGAGLFALHPDGRIRFVDRASGESFVFAPELGPVAAIATRTSTG